LMLLVKGAGLPDSVDGEDLLLANSLSQAGGTVFQAIGFVFGLGMSKVFKNVNEGWFAIASIALYAAAGVSARGIIRIETQKIVGTLGAALRGLVRSIVDGIKEVGRRPAAAIGILSFWFTRTLVFGFVGLSIVFAAVEANAAKKSIVASAVQVLFAGAGAAVGLFLAQWLKDRVAPAKVIAAFMVIAGGSALLAPFGAAGRYGATLFAGLAFFVVKVGADTITQRALPDDFRGRAYALFDISYALSYAIPAAVLYLATRAGISVGIAVAAYGVILVLVALAIGAWAKRLGLFAQVSDDLTEDQLATGIGE